MKKSFLFLSFLAAFFVIGCSQNADNSSSFKINLPYGVGEICRDEVSQMEASDEDQEKLIYVVKLTKAKDNFAKYLKNQSLETYRDNYWMPSDFIMLATGYSGETIVMEGLTPDEYEISVAAYDAVCGEFINALLDKYNPWIFTSLMGLLSEELDMYMGANALRDALGEDLSELQLKYGLDKYVITEKEAELRQSTQGEFGGLLPVKYESEFNTDNNWINYQVIKLKRGDNEVSITLSPKGVWKIISLTAELKNNKDKSYYDIASYDFDIKAKEQKYVGGNKTEKIRYRDIFFINLSKLDQWDCYGYFGTLPLDFDWNEQYELENENLNVFTKIMDFSAWPRIDVYASSYSCYLPLADPSKDKKEGYSRLEPPLVVSSEQPVYKFFQYDEQADSCTKKIDNLTIDFDYSKKWFSCDADGNNKKEITATAKDENLNAYVEKEYLYFPVNKEGTFYYYYEIKSTPKNYPDGIDSKYLQPVTKESEIFKVTVSPETKVSVITPKTEEKLVLAVKESYEYSDDFSGSIFDVKAITENDTKYDSYIWIVTYSNGKTETLDEKTYQVTLKIPDDFDDIRPEKITCFGIKDGAIVTEVTAEIFSQV